MTFKAMADDAYGNPAGLGERHPTMTRKDYVRIANAFDASRPRSTQTAVGQAMYMAWRCAVATMADALKAENPRFDSERFNAACGVEGR